MEKGRDRYGALSAPTIGCYHEAAQVWLTQPWSLRVPILTREFFRQEKGNHEETWYRLARDTETGDVFIEHEWTARNDAGTVRIELADFLTKHQGSAGKNLLRLIGTLVKEPS